MFSVYGFGVVCLFVCYLHPALGHHECTPRGFLVLSTRTVWGVDLICTVITSVFPRDINVKPLRCLNPDVLDLAVFVLRVGKREASGVSKRPISPHIHAEEHHFLCLDPLPKSTNPKP